MKYLRIPPIPAREDAGIAEDECLCLRGCGCEHCGEKYGAKTYGRASEV
jgi:hypothetical protein